jgi:multiple sugar transport system ATP-binding protein
LKLYILKREDIDMADLSLRHIYKIYEGDVTAVKDFNLEIEDKEFIVFVGPSGCGKSTTLRMIAGLEEISKGELYIGGKLVNDVEPKERDIAMVFQNYALYPHMTVYDNMAFALKLRKAPKDEIEKKVREAAKRLDIEHLLERKPKALSGGQRQRVALGRAIVREPKVFLMDEPLSNLDAKLRVQMRTEISKLYQSLGTTFIYVTHDQVEALTMGTRIVVMKDGIVQQVDSPLNIYNTPTNLFVAGFIGSPQMNLVNGMVVENDGKLYCKFEENNILLPEEKAKILKEKGYVNKEVVFGMRPEHLDDNIEIIEANPKATLTGSVEVVERMGAESYIYFKSGNNNMTARVDGSTKCEPKDKIKLYVENENIHVFDKETELRIC